MTTKKASASRPSSSRRSRKSLRITSPKFFEELADRLGRLLLVSGLTKERPTSPSTSTSCRLLGRVDNSSHTISTLTLISLTDGRVTTLVLPIPISLIYPPTRWKTSKDSSARSKLCSQLIASVLNKDPQLSNALRPVKKSSRKTSSPRTKKRWRRLPSS